jgi:hypothetical protein
MQPQAKEIEEVGNAFISLGYPEYTPQQQEFLNEFLKQAAQNLNETDLGKIFGENVEVKSAIKSLHQFAKSYQNEEEIFAEFKEEIDDLLITLNDADEGLII